jgi:chitin disaccharide deacetylase
MLLIVNADDLGASETVNNETFALMEAGLVTSATLMANGPAFADAVKQSKRFPGCSFGVHLNLTSFAPLSKSQHLASALRGGELSPELLHQRLPIGLRKALEEELILQVQRAVDAGILVTHVDSHHFIHSRQELFFAVKEVQKRFGIRKVRCTFEIFSKASALQKARRKLFDYALRTFYASVSPDGWSEFRSFYPYLVRHQLPDFSCMELLVHPGTKNSGFQEDITLLKSDWHSSLPETITVGSYHLL